MRKKFLSPAREIRRSNKDGQGTVFGLLPSHYYYDTTAARYYIAPPYQQKPITAEGGEVSVRDQIG
jgi:hypothetical protein